MTITFIQNGLSKSTGSNASKITIAETATLASQPGRNCDGEAAEDELSGGLAGLERVAELKAEAEAAEGELSGGLAGLERGCPGTLAPPNPRLKSRFIVFISFARSSNPFHSPCAEKPGGAP